MPNWRQVGTGWAHVKLEMSPKVVAVCFQGLARLSRRVRRRFVHGSRQISLVPSLHRASTEYRRSDIHSLARLLSSTAHNFCTFWQLSISLAIRDNVCLERFTGTRRCG